MNDCTRVASRRSLATPRAMRTAAAIAAVVLAMLAAGCTGGRSSAGASNANRSPSPGASTGSTSAVAYSACMRSHGIPNFPDPGSDGHVPKTDARALGVSSPRFQAAQTACQNLYPDNGSLDQQTQECMLTGNCPQALVQQLLTVERRFAQCMRSHGLPHWPDPTVDTQGRPLFVISISRDLGGVDVHAPQISSKEDLCGQQTGSPEPRQVNP